MQLPVCELKYCNSNEMHLAQVIAGYKMLHDEKIIKLNAIYDASIKSKYVHNSIVEVTVDKETLLVYDLADGYQSFHDMEAFDKLLATVDFYYKRSLEPNLHKTFKNAHKLKPLGLNYHVSCKGNPFDMFVWDDRSLHQVKDWIYYLRSNRRFQRNYYYKRFEGTPKYFSEYKVLFLARLWDPSAISLQNIIKSYTELSLSECKVVCEKWQNDMIDVNKQRVTCIKMLSSELGDKFVGGLEGNAYAQTHYQGLIAPQALTMKYSFIELLKQNYICIASKGLHGSIGWKMGEYVAAARAIITDPLKYSLTGNFERNKNYLSYDTAEDCLRCAVALLSNPDKTYAMELENYSYYLNFVRPNNMILNSLREAQIL